LVSAIRPGSYNRGARIGEPAELHTFNRNAVDHTTQHHLDQHPIDACPTIQPNGDFRGRDAIGPSRAIHPTPTVGAALAAFPLGIPSCWRSSMAFFRLLHSADDLPLHNRLIYSRRHPVIVTPQINTRYTLARPIPA
jgi:hypothetical protein